MVTPGTAWAPTSTVSVMVLDAPGFIGAGAVQVTNSSTAEQVQPSPMTEKYDKPVGSVLVTVVVPAARAAASMDSGT